MIKISKCLVVIGLLTTVLTGGCASKLEGMNKERDLEFTVVCEKDIPSTLKDVIEEKKEKPFQISYTSGDELYIAVGYGIQETGGYSITVNELYETADTVVMDTTLIGPDKQEAISPSYPYIVVKTEAVPDKTIEFR